ncbi:hypothetical protein [Endozoicomonas atrinae]|uniref:hypothetical protein n=1 Tax=Endozoicomonas atrinae TaxID=1333660 RepID=UPI000824FF04|nr:hypothetical protein [Endozoicomonas atrinae]
MARYTILPAMNIGGGKRYKPKGGKLKKKGKFKLRKVARKYRAKLLIRVKRTGSVLRIRIHFKDRHKSPVEQTIHLKSFHKINGDGDRIPDEKTVQQMKSFVDETKDLPFALSKVGYHTDNQERLSQRSRAIVVLRRRPNWQKMQNIKLEQEKALGGISQELNEVARESYIQKTKELIHASGLDEVTKKDLVNYLDGKKEYSRMTKDESKRVLERFQKRIAELTKAKKAQKEGDKVCSAFSQSIPRILPANERMI